MSLQQVVDFVLELEKLKAVTRKTRPIGLERYENSAEHSWQLALFAASLAHFADVPVDVSHVTAMLLVHDIGEIDAGDTMVYVQGGWAERKAEELAGVSRVCGLLPAASGLRFLALWQEFEDAVTPEAKFAHAVDRAMPVLLNLHNDGQSWRENGITYEQVVTRVGPPIAAGCPALWRDLQVRLDTAARNGWFGTS